MAHSSEVVSSNGLTTEEQKKLAQILNSKEVDKLVGIDVPEKKKEAKK